jgi:HlyD family secretion protein
LRFWIPKGNALDIPREDQTKKKRLRKIAAGGAGVLCLGLVTVGLSRLSPAAPAVERGSLWIDTVKRGSMLRQVRGPGTLVPEEIRWIPALSEARVDRIAVLPGAVVKPETLLVELSNPEIELAASDAALHLKAAEAELVELRVTLQSKRLDQEASAARIQSEFRQATLKAGVDEAMSKQGLVSDLTVKLSRVTAEEMAQRDSLEKKRLVMDVDAVAARLAAQEARVDQVRAQARLKKSQLEGLEVRAGIAGVLQQVPVQVGQRVTPGTNLARVADPARLKAALRIVETQAKDVVVGQDAEVDTRNGVVKGRVVRIDPAVQNGTVTVDIAFTEPLPKGARPDLSVDGTVELERLADVLHVGRPALCQEKTQVWIFRLIPGSAEAARVKVSLGRGSATAIEIAEGLAEGDRVILSDTSSWDAHDRIRLH